MSLASVATHPPGRVFTALWRFLEPYAPRRIWFADLLVRRLDLLVRIDKSEFTDQLHRLLIEAVSARGQSPAVLAKRLGLNDRMLRMLLAELTAHDLVRVDERGDWIATEAGMQVAGAGHTPAPIVARRTFRLLADSHTFFPLKAGGAPTTLSGGTRQAIQILQRRPRSTAGLEAASRVSRRCRTNSRR